MPRAMLSSETASGEAARRAAALSIASPSQPRKFVARSATRSCPARVRPLMVRAIILRSSCVRLDRSMRPDSQRNDAVITRAKARAMPSTAALDPMRA